MRRYDDLSRDEQWLAYRSCVKALAHFIATREMTFDDAANGDSFQAHIERLLGGAAGSELASVGARRLLADPEVSRVIDVLARACARRSTYGD